jgi:hypothetical protein
LPKGSIEFLTKSFVLEGGAGETQLCFEKYGGYIEISVVLMGDREPVEKSEETLGRTPSIYKDEMLELMLQLAREMVLKNRGIMKFETDEKRTKKIISLGFPIERRREVFYESMT